MKVALLGNEGCAGGCAMMKEHFHPNNTRTDGPGILMIQSVQ